MCYQLITKGQWPYRLAGFCNIHNYQYVNKPIFTKVSSTTSSFSNLLISRYSQQFPPPPPLHASSSSNFKLPSIDLRGLQPASKSAHRGRGYQKLGAVDRLDVEIEPRRHFRHAESAPRARFRISRPFLPSSPSISVTLQNPN